MARVFALVSAVALIAAAALLAYVTVRVTIGGPLIGTTWVRWSSDPLVFGVELGLAAGIILASATVAREVVTGPISIRHTLTWFGLGVLALGVLAVAVGWAGFFVPTPAGVNDLEREEWAFVLGGLAASLLGGLMTLPSLVSFARHRLA